MVSRLSKSLCAWILGQWPCFPISLHGGCDCEHDQARVWRFGDVNFALTWCNRHYAFNRVDGIADVELAESSWDLFGCHLTKDRDGYKLDLRRAMSNKLWQYYWCICQCGRASGGWNWYDFKNLQHAEVKQTCSIECYQRRVGNVCEVCMNILPEVRGRIDGKTVVFYRRGRGEINRYCDYMWNVASRLRIQQSESFYEALTQRFCSRQCCLLALESAYRVEQEKRTNREELQCVQRVRRVLAKSKKQLLRDRSQEALMSLKKEFELAAILPK